MSIYREDITKNLKTKQVSKINAKLMLDVFICIQYDVKKEEKIALTWTTCTKHITEKEINH